MGSSAAATVGTRQSTPSETTQNIEQSTFPSAPGALLGVTEDNKKIAEEGGREAERSGAAS